MTCSTLGDLVSTVVSSEMSNAHLHVFCFEPNEHRSDNMKKASLKGIVQVLYVSRKAIYMLNPDHVARPYGGIIDDGRSGSL